MGQTQEVEEGIMKGDRRQPSLITLDVVLNLMVLGQWWEMRKDTHRRLDVQYMWVDLVT